MIERADREARVKRLEDFEGYRRLQERKRLARVETILGRRRDHAADENERRRLEDAIGYVREQREAV